MTGIFPDYISSGLRYLFKLYRARGFKEGMFPVAERVGKQIVSLPIFYAMYEADVEHTCAAMHAVLQAG